MLQHLEAKAELKLEAIWQLLPQEIAEAMLESKRQDCIGLDSGVAM